MTVLSAGAGGLGGFLSARRFSGRRTVDPATTVASPMCRAERAAGSAVGDAPVTGRSVDAERDAAAPDSGATASGQVRSRAVDAPDTGAGRETEALPPSAPHADFALSLADVYMASGWWDDAEAILRDAIAQQGDGPIYRARLLRVLFQLGRRDRFLQAFDAYRTVADPADRGWEEIRRMGRALWPSHAAFTAPGNDGDAPIDEYEFEYEVDFELVLDDLSPAPSSSRNRETGSAGEDGFGDYPPVRGISSEHDGDDDDLSRQ